MSGDELRPVQRLRAGGVLMDERGRILLARAGASNPDFPGMWCLPGGGVEQGEHPEQTVAREFREETGLVVSVGRLRLVHSAVDQLPRRGVSLHMVSLIYDVQVNSGELRSELGGTTDLVRWVETAVLAELALMPDVLAALGSLRTP